MIRPAQKEDWTSFLQLAADEGWRVPRLESMLFQDSWQQHAYAFREDNRFCGLVTAVPHQKSGWIGNLIVPADLRGRGYGQQLFYAAIERLNAQGVSSIWLTASRLGQPIYEKAGFVEVDEIERWVSETRSPPADIPEGLTGDMLTLGAADEAAWGERRDLLLEAVTRQGQVIACAEAVALLQKDQDLQILGPWYGPKADINCHRRLVQAVFAMADPQQELVVDVLKSSPLKPLLAEAGFHCAGRNTLMVKGGAKAAKLSSMVSLASLGSVG